MIIDKKGCDEWRRHFEKSAISVQHEQIILLSQTSSNKHVQAVFSHYLYLLSFIPDGMCGVYLQAFSSSKAI